MSNEPLTPPPSNFNLGDAISSFGKLLPWAKITAPMIAVIVCFYFLGNWLFNTYALNLQYKRFDAFPTSNSLFAFFISALIIIAVYLGLSIWHFKRHIANIK